MTLTKYEATIHSKMDGNRHPKDQTVISTSDIRVFRRGATNEHFNASILRSSPERKIIWHNTLVNLWETAMRPIQANVRAHFKVLPDGQVLFKHENYSEILDEVKDPACLIALLSDIAREFYSVSGIGNTMVTVINQPPNQINVEKRPLMIGSIFEQSLRWISRTPPGCDVYLESGDWMYVAEESHLQHLELLPSPSAHKITMAVLVTEAEIP